MIYLILLLLSPLVLLLSISYFEPSLHYRLSYYFFSLQNLLKVNTSSGRAGLSSQPMPRAKETLSRVAAPRVSSEKFSDFVQSNLDFSKEHGRSCDICRRSETILNPILVCSSCKVF